MTQERAGSSHSLRYMNPTATLRALIGTLITLGGVLLAGRVVSQPVRQAAPVDTVEVVNSWPHDPGAYTQGLVYHEGRFLESTGLYGESSLREVELETGTVLRYVPLSREYFGEGLALYGGQLIQITWREQRGFVYALEDFSRLSEWTYAGEGWGLTHDGARLIMSDGTSRLRFLDPMTLEVTGTLDVTDESGPVRMLNELEWIRGEIWANVYLTDRIVRIDPTSGTVLGSLDLRGLLPESARAGRQVDVLNGIAYDPATDRIFLTGKLWPLLFEVRVRGTAGTTSTAGSAGAPPAQTAARASLK